jgi:hypothetical protein
MAKKEEDLSKSVEDEVNSIFNVLKKILPPSIAHELVEIRDSSFCKGKGLFVTREMLGAEILMIEDPFAYVNLVEDSASHCKKNPFLGAVNAPKFFGDPEYAIKNTKRSELPPMFNLMLNILDKFPSANNATIKKWCKQFANEKLDQLDMYMPLIKDALKIRKNMFPFLDKKTMILLFNTVHCNALLSKSPLLIDVNYGAGLWIKGSKINHSCDPNCMISIVQGKLYVSAVRDIPAGEEVTIDYNRHYGSSVFASMYRDQQNTEQKKNRDKGIYGFECVCNVCKSYIEKSSPAADRFYRIGIEDLELADEELRKWNYTTNIMYTGLYQIAKEYNPGAHRMLSMEEAAKIRKIMISILDDATKMIYMTKRKDPLELLGMQPFSTIIKLILIELVLRGKGTDFTTKRLKNAKAIAGYLLENQKTNENLEQVEMAMVASALRILVNG